MAKEKHGNYTLPMFEDPPAMVAISLVAATEPIGDGSGL